MVKSLSRLELEAIVRDIPSAVLVVAKGGRIIYANNNATSLFGSELRGFTLSSQTGLSFFSLTGEPLSVDKLPARQALAMGMDIDEDFILERLDGTRAVVRGLASPVRDEQGNVLASVGIFEDITERKIVEGTVEEERQTLRGIIDSSETMIAYFDLQFNFLIVNTAYARDSGYTVEQLLGKNHFKLFPNAENQAIFEKVRETGQPAKFFDKPFTFVNQPERGVTYWDWTLTPVRGNDGRVCGLALALMETTERKKAEDKLIDSEQRFRLVAEAAKVLVYEQSSEHGNVAVIRGEEVLGYGAGEIPKSQQWWLEQVHPDDRKRTSAKLRDSMATGKDYFLEYRIRRKNGKYITVHDTGKVILGNDDKVVQFVGGLRDVTERKQHEQALLRSQKKLEEKTAQVEEYANSMELLAQQRLRQLKDAERLAAIGATASMVGHDIRNPLQAITGDIYLIKEELREMPNPVKDEVAESLESIDKNIAYINKIVSDLQDYSRNLNPDCSFTNLTEVVRQTFTAIDFPQNITVTNNTGHIELRTDAQFLRRALTNLVNNAVQAMPKGGKLAIEAYETDRKVVLTVGDTGEGIPDSVKPKLFTPMMTTKSKGQGLGLAVTKRLVEALDGKITYESEVGRGTKFIIELPQVKF